MILLLAHDDAGALPAAAAVFAIAALTDAVDGHVARSRNLITSFGRLADPLADKLLVGGALISLVAVERLAGWIAAVIIAREVLVSLLRWHASTTGVTVAVSSLGKAKTGAQMLAIALLMLVPDPDAAWVDGVLGGVVAITVASGLGYALAYVRRTTPAPAVSVAR